MNKRIIKFTLVLVTLLALFVGAAGVSADKGTPPPGGPSVPGGPLTGGPLLAGGPDAFGYTFIDSLMPGGPTYAWDEISGTGTALPVGDDTVSGAIPLGFTFSYYGTNYSDIYIGSNGFLTVLAAQDSGCCNGLVLPNAASPNGIIAGYWADLVPGTVYYQALGVAPNRRFVVEWTGAPFFWEPGDSATFEIKLFEGSNVIEVHYVGTSIYNTMTASLGIEDTTGTIGLTYAQGNIGVATGAIRYTPPPRVGLSTISIDFGNQLMGTTSASQSVTVTNTGSADLHIGTLSFTSDWILSNDTCSSATVVPAGTCTFDVAFHPLALGPLTGSITIPSDAASSPDSVSLSGAAVPATTVPQLLKMPTFDKIILPITWKIYWPTPAPFTGVRDCTVSLSPGCSVKFFGAGTNLLHYANQTFIRRGVAGEKFYFGLSSRAQSVPGFLGPNPNRPLPGLYKVEIFFYDLRNQVVGSSVLNFTNGTHDWETVGAIYTVPAAYYRVAYRFTFQKTAGTAWFDNAFLMVVP